MKRRWPRRFPDLLPWSSAIENLDALLLDALELPKELDALQSSWVGPEGTREAAEMKLRLFRDRVIERSEYIAEVRAARILREAIPPPRVFGTRLDLGLTFEPLRAWINGVIGNIESELEAIERQQAMFVTLIATLIALLAAIAAIASVGFEFSNWLRARY